MDTPAFYSPSLTSLDGKRICITGANGFIGRSLLAKLLEIDCRIRVLTRSKTARFDDRIEVHIGDLTDADHDLSHFVIGCDVLFHCAGEIHDVQNMRALHVDGTRRLLETLHNAAQATRKAVHWIQLSSGGAYGPPPKNAIQVERQITEQTEVRPANEYEMTKTESDHLVIASAGPLMTYSIFRPTNVIGAEMTNHSMRKLIQTVRTGRFFFIGKKDAIATYVHIDDVVNAMTMLAAHPQSKNEVFNLSSDCTWDALITEIALNLGVKKPTIRAPALPVQAALFIANLFVGRIIRIPHLTVLAHRTRFPTTKIESKLGFKHLKPLPQSIVDVIESIPKSLVGTAR